jgi:ATP-dependent DNA helicase UvrD/PcrA
VLSDEQRAVVEAPAGPTVVLAGAGSGKTRALTHRVARLVASGVGAERILLCTFTSRAARELSRRAAALDGARGAQAIFAGTFHQLAHRVLRQHGAALGLPAQFKILDRGDAEELLAACLDEEPAGAGRARLPGARTLAQLLSLAVNRQARLAEVIRERLPRLGDEVARVEAIGDRYAARKARHGALDFDDLLFFWKLLLVERPEVAAVERARIEHLLVDEYQDSSRLQGEIVDLYAAEHGRLTVVGDPAQAIYSFRGADPRNLLEFAARHAGARVLTLATNYRSTGEIVALANRCLERGRAPVMAPLVAARVPGARPTLVSARDAQAEAAFVADRVASGEEPPGETAVLYRNHAHAVELELELRRRRIPYRVRAGARFFQQAHVKDAVAYLKLARDPLDDLAFRRVRRIEGASARRERVLDFLDGREAREGSSGRAPAALLERVIARYSAHAARAFDDAAARLDDLRALASWAARFATLAEAVAELELADSELDAPAAGALTLSTVHQAKGLEWDAVIVIGLADGRFPLAGAELDEERRLFYVALTRARERLYLCHALADSQGPARPSRYLDELAPRCLRASYP